MKSMTTKLLALASLAFTVSSSAYDFPSFDIMHSHCAVSVVIPNKLCTSVYSDITNTVNKFNAGQDPSGGVYQYKEKQPISYMWLIHVSKRGWNSDILLEPTQVNGDCQIRGRSRTTSTFHIAGTENYCDLWNLYQAIGPYTQMDINSCSSVPRDPSSTCTN